MKSGTKLRHIVGGNLKMLEEQIESMPFRVEIVSINSVAANWYIHFLTPSLVPDDERIAPTIAVDDHIKVTRKKFK